MKSETQDHGINVAFLLAIAQQLMNQQARKQHHNHKPGFQFAWR